ncbi:MAG TPA: hypothetical protein VG937_30290 [Polyangiaceae bacterium]|nr:hypothetical protein [Polyangiaceae bacterium]
MERIEALLRRAARNAARRVSLDEALLSDRALAYVWYRNRFLLLRIPLGVVLHVAEVLAFSDAFELGIIGPMLAIRSLPAVAGALWWGALEELRASVRACAARGDWGRAERFVRSYLGLAVDVAIAGVALAIAFIQWGPSEFEGFDIFDAYALACALRFGLEALTRTYHAGIFAVRRVYRPLWSLVLPDVAELLLALSLWSVLGPWGFSLSLLFGGVLGAGLQTHYVAKAYREHGAFRPRLRRLGQARKDLERNDLWVLGRHALANLATHVDALLILFLSGTAAGGSGVAFVVLLHSLRPLLSAVSSYARVFYFDFKRLSLGTLAFFEQRFARVVNRFAWRLAALVSALSIALDLFVFRGELRVELGLLAAYTFARSLLSVQQLRAFTLERYGPLAKGALGALLVLFCVRALLPHEIPLVAAQIALLFVLAFWLERLNSRARAPRAVPGEGVGALRFLALLAREPGAVRLGSAALDPRLDAPMHGFVGGLSATLDGLVFSRIGRRGVIWYQQNPSQTVAEVRERALRAGAGSLTRLTVSECFQSGSQALTPALELLSSFPGASAKQSQPAQVSNLSELNARFRREFPDGQALDLDHPASARLLKDRAQVRAILQAIQAVCLGKPGSERERSLPRCTPFCPDGEPEVVFLAPASSESAAFQAFASEVRSASLAVTLARARVSR